MKFPKIAAALGWTEEPSTAEDGIFLQAEEAAKVEAFVLKAESAESAAANLVTANNTIQELNGKINAADTAATTATNRITELEGQVATLGKQSSGKGTVVPTPADEVVTEKTGAKVGLNHRDHPLNQMAAKRTATKKAVTAK